MTALADILYVALGIACFIGWANIWHQIKQEAKQKGAIK